MVKTTSGDKSVAVYLNTALVEKKTFISFPPIGDKEKIVFGSAVKAADGTLEG